MVIDRPVRSVSRTRWRRPPSAARCRGGPCPRAAALGRGRLQQLDRALLQHPGPDPLLDVLAATQLQHHRVDAVQVEEVRQQQPGRPRPDDPHLGPHGRSLSDDAATEEHATPGPSGWPAAAAREARLDGRPHPGEAAHLVGDVEGEDHRPRRHPGQHGRQQREVGGGDDGQRDRDAAEEAVDHRDRARHGEQELGPGVPDVHVGQGAADVASDSRK